jgi:hypothetical protein
VSGLSSGSAPGSTGPSSGSAPGSSGRCAILLLLTLVTEGIACGGGESSRIRGWPPAEADRALFRPQAADIVAPAADAGASDPETASEADAVADAGSTDVLPCAQLVTLACELAGTHDDRCREARKRPPDDGHGPTREGCAELLGRVQESDVTRGSACHRYVKALCALHGDGSERCVAARSTLALARTRREQRICQADWLLLEARVLRR